MLNSAAFNQQSSLNLTIPLVSTSERLISQHDHDSPYFSVCILRISSLCAFACACWSFLMRSVAHSTSVYLLSQHQWWPCHCVLKSLDTIFVSLSLKSKTFHWVTVQKGLKKKLVTSFSSNIRHNSDLLSWWHPLTPLRYTILVLLCHLIFTAVGGWQSRWALSYTNKAHLSSYLYTEPVCSTGMNTIILCCLFVSFFWVKNPNWVLTIYYLTFKLIKPPANKVLWPECTLWVLLQSLLPSLCNYNLWKSSRIHIYETADS